MRPSRIKAKLRRGEPVLVTTIHAIDPSFHEMASLMGFDGLWLDLEHHPVSLETAAGLMRAARVGTADALVRPAKGEFMRLGRVLEAGAQGIMYPRCSDAAEAREVVQWAKFAPLGRRGVDSGNADTPYCLMPLDEFYEAYEQASGLTVDPERLRWYEILSRFVQVQTVLGTAYRVARLGKSHQDILVARMEGAAYVIAEELRQALEEVI